MIKDLEKINNISEEYKGKFERNKDVSNKFAEIYKNALSQMNTKSKLTKKAQDILDKLAEKLNVEITEKDFDSEGNLSILQIIRRSSSEIEPKELKDFKDSIYKLWLEGAITLKEYFDVIQWLSNHYKADKIKENCTDYFMNIIDSDNNMMDKEKKYGTIY